MTGRMFLSEKDRRHRCPSRSDGEHVLGHLADAGSRVAGDAEQPLAALGEVADGHPVATQDAAVFGATGGELGVGPALLGQPCDTGVEAVVLTMERNDDPSAEAVGLIDDPDGLDGGQLVEERVRERSHGQSFRS